MSTPNTWITEAVREAQIIGAMDASAAAEHISVGMSRLNHMFGEWNLSGKLSRFEKMQTFALTAPTQSMTIGTTANSATLQVDTGDRPVKINTANWLIASDPEQVIPLKVIQVDQYANIDLPTMEAAYPDRLYYQPKVPNGLIWMWPVPTTTTDSLQLFWWTQWDAVTDSTLNTDVPLAPGEEGAIVLSLAERLKRPFQKPYDGDLARDAAKARACLGAVNTIVPEMNTTGLISLAIR